MAAPLSRIILKYSDELLSTISIDTATGGPQALSLGELMVSVSEGQEALCFRNDQGDFVALRAIDLDLGTPSSGQYFRYNGTSWVNSNILIGDLPDLSAVYATAAQGALADSAVQPGDNVSVLVNDSNYVTSDPSGATGADVITNMVSLTEAEYLALTPDPATLYVLI